MRPPLLDAAARLPVYAPESAASMGLAAAPGWIPDISDGGRKCRSRMRQSPGPVEPSKGAPLAEARVLVTRRRAVRLLGDLAGRPRPREPWRKPHDPGVTAFAGGPR